MPFFSVVISNSLLTGPTFPIIPVVYYSQASSLKFSNIKNEVFKTREENILPSTSIQLSLTSDVHNFYTPFFLNIAHTTTHHTSRHPDISNHRNRFPNPPFFQSLSQFSERPDYFNSLVVIVCIRMSAQSLMYSYAGLLEGYWIMGAYRWLAVRRWGVVSRSNLLGAWSGGAISFPHLLSFLSGCLSVSFSHSWPTRCVHLFCYPLCHAALPWTQTSTKCEPK